MKYLARLFVLFSVLSMVLGCSLKSHRLVVTSINREQLVNQYLDEFCSPVFRSMKIGQAIFQVLMEIPPDALEKVLDRRRPVLFTEMFDAGTAKYASSSEIVSTPQDLPAFQEGMTILKLSTALEHGPVEATKGIVAHELAHRVLDHVRLGKVSCQAEREANRLIKTWGFVKEFEAASQHFGAQNEPGAPKACQEEDESAT